MRDKRPTPHSTLLRAKKIATGLGIKYCYVGNVHDIKNQSTYFSNCGSLLIERDWHSTNIVDLIKDKCLNCGYLIPGVFF
jgi:pyruvate formate lyase activating enzyme